MTNIPGDIAEQFRVKDHINYKERVRVDSGNSSITYYCYAPIDAGTSEQKWRIVRVDESAGGSGEKDIDPAGNGEFAFSFDNRENITYQ